jgi:formiminotetrahydrofolate cyclodeaminase
LSIAYTSLWNLTAEDIRSGVASISPTPGGGSVSVITAILGLALVHKGTSVSLKKSAANAARHESLVDLRMKLASTMESLSRFADEDASAFQSYVQARSIPNTSEGESAARRTSMNEALLRATQIPIESAAEMARGLNLAETAMALADAHVLTDIFAGALLLHASIKAVLLNLDANLPGIEDEELRETMKQRRIELEDASALRVDAVAHTYRARISIL